jgi:hypothetical protein
MKQSTLFGILLVLVFAMIVFFAYMADKSGANVTPVQPPPYVNPDNTNNNHYPTEIYDPNEEVQNYDEGELVNENEVVQEDTTNKEDWEW